VKHRDTSYWGELFQGIGIVATGRGLLEPRCDLLNLTEIFDWGNGITDGARQFAFALLVDFAEDEAFARNYFERFAQHTIAPLATKWVMNGASIIADLRAIEAQATFDFEDLAARQ
jgi:hypothetical protein